MKDLPGFEPLRFGHVPQGWVGPADENPLTFRKN